MVGLLDLPDEILLHICNSIDTFPRIEFLLGEGPENSESSENTEDTDDTEDLEEATGELEDSGDSDDSDDSADSEGLEGSDDLEDSDGSEGSADSEDLEELEATEEPAEHDSQTTFYNLCLVNSKVRGIAQPLLFRNFAEDADGDALLYLLRTLAESPRIRSYMICLGIGDIYFELPYESTPLVDAIRSLDVDFAEEWIKRLSADHQDVRADAIIALFWALLPNLKAADFSWPNCSGVIMEKLIRTHRIPSWSKIEQIAIMQWDHDADFLFGAGASMITMPQLRRVEMRQIRTHEDTFDVGPQTVAARHLVFEETYFIPQVVRSIVESCKALNRVDFYQIAGYKGDMAPQEVVDMLAMHGATLKRLELNFSDFHAAHSGPSAMKIHSFDGLPELKELRIDQKSLTLSSQAIVLPSKLTVLTVHLVSDDFAAAVGVLEERLDEFKQLTAVRLFGCLRADESLFQEYRAKFAKRNVEFFLDAPNVME